MLSSISLVHFSPTGGSRVISRLIGERLAKDQTEVDLSFPGFTGHQYTQDEVVVAAVPVYGGRVPATAVERLKRCQGNGALAVALVTYGNRHYEDALLELCDVLTEKGFRVVAAAALVAPHSLVPEFGRGRPDEKDLVAYDSFADDILRKIEADNYSLPKDIKGDRPYKAWSPAPVIPVADDSCTNCGECADSCPTDAIPDNDYTATDRKKCLLCARCIHICPAQARTLPQEYAAKVKEFLSKTAVAPRAPEFFL